MKKLTSIERTRAKGRLIPNVRETLARGLTIHEIAVEKAKVGALKHVDTDRLVSVEEIETALGDLQRLTGSP